MFLYVPICTYMFLSVLAIPRRASVQVNFREICTTGDGKNFRSHEDASFRRIAKHETQF